MRVVLCVVAATFFAGCPSKKAPEPVVSESASSYARGFNRISALCGDRIRTYFAAVPRNTAEFPLPRPLLVTGPRDDKAVDEAAAMFAAGRAKQPAPVPVLGDALVAAARKVLVAYRAASAIADSAAAKTVHAQFVAAADGYRSAAFQLEDSLFAAEDQATIDELPKYAAARRWGYWFRVVEIQAKKALRAAKRGDVEGQGDVFRTAYEEMVKFVEAEPEPPQEARIWLRSADVFFDAVAAVKEGGGEPAQAQLLQAYNQLAAAENVLRTMESQGKLK